MCSLMQDMLCYKSFQHFNVPIPINPFTPLLLEYRIVTINPRLIDVDYIIQIVGYLLLIHFNVKFFCCAENKCGIHRTHT